MMARFVVAIVLSAVFVTLFHDAAVLAAVSGGQLDALNALVTAGILETAACGKIDHRYNVYTEVVCDGDDVTQITAKGISCAKERVFGQIPPEIGLLAELTSLRLSTDNEQCHGSSTIPSEIGQLAKLETLFLSDSYISGGSQWLQGTIPPEIGSATALTSVQITYVDSLVGEIPPQLCALPALGHLALTQSNVSGVVPPQCFESSTLTWLKLDGDASRTVPLTLPETGVTSCPGLTMFEFQLASFPVPTWLQLCTQLTHIRLSGHTGYPQQNELPVFLKALSGLTSFILSQLNFPTATVDQVNELVSGWPALEVFQMEFCQMSFELTDLDLSASPNLVTLYLGSNDLTGSLPPQSTVPSLRTLSVSSNSRLDGILDAGYFNLPSLTSFDFYRTDLRFPASVGQCTSGFTTLGTIRLTPCALGQEGCMLPHDIGNCAQLTYLSLMGGWSAPLPASLSRLTALTIIDIQKLAFDPLDGTVMPSLANMTGLHTLQVQQSGLSQFPQLPPAGLQVIWLYRNLLAEEFPGQSLCDHAATLRMLHLNSNGLFGSLPACISSLTQLTWLDVSANRLSGTFPALPPSLTTVSAKGNMFACPVGDFSHVATNDWLQTKDSCGGCPYELFASQGVTSVDSMAMREECNDLADSDSCDIQCSNPRRTPASDPFGTSVAQTTCSNGNLLDMTGCRVFSSSINSFQSRWCSPGAFSAWCKARFV